MTTIQLGNRLATEMRTTASYISMMERITAQILNWKSKHSRPLAAGQKRPESCILMMGMITVPTST